MKIAEFLLYFVASAGTAAAFTAAPSRSGTAALAPPSFRHANSFGVSTRRRSSSSLFMQAVNGAAEKKTVIVLGGDGFCGWPTSLYLSDIGHDVVIVDNLSRRNIDNELGCSSLTPIQPPEVRVKAWKEVSGKEIKFVNLDVAKDYDLLVQLIKDVKPDSIVHFAEQRAAPYSMKTSKAKR